MSERLGQIGSKEDLEKCVGKIVPVLGKKEDINFLFQGFNGRHYIFYRQNDEHALIIDRLEVLAIDVKTNEQDNGIPLGKIVINIDDQWAVAPEDKNYQGIQEKLSKYGGWRSE